METIKILIFAFHHPFIYCLEPYCMEGSGDGADDDYCAVSYCVAEDSGETNSCCHGHKEHDEFEDELELVLYIILACDFVVERKCLLVEYCKVEQQTIAWSCSE